jgi:hypothetical protein
MYLGENRRQPMLKQVLEIYELLDSPRINGVKVREFLREKGLERIEVKHLKGGGGSTDFVKILIPGIKGKGEKGKDGAQTLGIIGRSGGVGARPKKIGIVSDADGVIVALACALKLAEMRKKGDKLKGDVLVTTHICPNAPTQPHQPVPFMSSPVEIGVLNKLEVDPSMDAILSVDTTKGNRIINFGGFAITPTVKEGYVLRVSEDLLDLMEWVTGKEARVVPITFQDITPYGNGIYHLNSMMQPCTMTKAPVVGIGITSQVPVPGCATGVSRANELEEAGRYCLEVAKAFGEGECKFYDKEEFKLIKKLYGSMKHLQTLGTK